MGDRRYGQRWAQVRQQLSRVWIHTLNGLSDWLGNDIVSCSLRGQLLTGMGAELGPGTVVRGGSYFYGGQLKTGANCQINRGCYFDFTGPVTLGDRVTIGHGVTFVTAHHTLGDAACRAGSTIVGRPIQLHSGVWVGANATLLPGVTVHQGAVVAAGAVVTRDVAANTLVAGVPARAIKQLAASPSLLDPSALLGAVQ